VNPSAPPFRVQAVALDADPRTRLSPDNFRYLRQYIQQESGIQVGEEKLYLLESRLLPVITREKIANLDELCHRLRHRPAPGLRQQVVEAMTTHETLFFRDPAVYTALRDSLLPELLQRNRDTKTIRVWSAACSSGQEPYSIAMMLTDRGVADWKIEILATDLSEQILERARQARYQQIEVNRGLPAPLLVKYFERHGLEWHIKPAIRSLVRFQPFDLRSNIASLGNFDLVLCRNVMIYFDLPTRKQILSGIRRTLRPGGYLLLGASETTFNVDDNYLRKSVSGAIVYQTPSQGFAA
jgi:chemotaxis protein methyltransferase CheR